MHLHVLGSGDAFGSAGRFNTCFLVDRGDESFLIDCGASAMIARCSVTPMCFSQIGSPSTRWTISVLT